MVTTPRSPDAMDLIRARAAANGDNSYGDFVSAVPFSYYQRRVKELGLARLGRVLDVGCGYGHWTAALAEVNDEAVGIDQSEPRLAIAREFASSLGLENVTLDLGDAARLPYPDESFDGLVCYGVFQFLNRDDALADFHRVLAPGGRLYVLTAAKGWWLAMWVKSLRGDPNLRRSAFHGWARSGRGSPPHAVSRRRARRLLRNGWTNVEAGFDGELGANEQDPTPSVYASRWLGIDSVVEFVAEREPAGSSRKAIDRDSGLDDVLALARGTHAQHSYEYQAPLARHPQPQPVVDLVNNCDPVVVREALDRARAVDKLQLLRVLYGELTDGIGADDDEARVTACVTFAQKHFFHHFAAQPMVDGVSVHDPIASLLIGHGRCATSARFLVDLFECNGVPARLVGGACHTWPEVLCNGRWFIADANLYPPGVLPRNEEGRLLTLEEAISSPDLLNRVPSYVNYHYEYIDAYLAEYPETEAELAQWLRFPLLPSTGYFGADFFSGDVGVIQRHRKNGTPEQWVEDGYFGWGSLDLETVQGPALPLEQRPGQVRDAAVDGGYLSWSPVVLADGQPAGYRVVSSPQSRGWEYDALPVGCMFEVEGAITRVDEPRVSLHDVRRGGNFVTVVAENPVWADRGIFYLPSRELYVG